MSLVCAIDVNRIGTGAGLIAVQRLTGTSDPSSVNQYRYEIYGTAGALIATGEVQHCYGDGAIGLLRHVLTDSDTTRPCASCGADKHGEVIDGRWICDRCRYLAARRALRTGWTPGAVRPRLTAVDNKGDA